MDIQPTRRKAELVRDGIHISLGPFQMMERALTEGLFQADRCFYVDRESGFELGFWEGTQGEFEARRNGYTEMFHILSGRAVLHTEGGDSVALSPGDTVVTPSGWSGRWEILEPVRKLYVVITDRSG